MFTYVDDEGGSQLTGTFVSILAGHLETSSMQ